MRSAIYRYVLLGGDTEVIPYRSLYVDTGYDTADHPPLRFLFRRLGWRLEQRWATTAGVSRGEEDWYAELAVGRASVSTTTEAQELCTQADFLSKQIRSLPMYHSTAWWAKN